MIMYFSPRIFGGEEYLCDKFIFSFMHLQN